MTYPSSAANSRPRKRSAWIVVVLLLLVVGLLVALFLGRLAFLTQFLPTTSDQGSANNTEEQISDIVTYEMRKPLEIVLNSGQENRVYLSLSLSFKLSSTQDVPFVRKLEPAIRDTMIPYLQELRPEELEGSRGIFLLREELLFRINKVTGSVRVEDLFIESLQLQ